MKKGATTHLERLLDLLNIIALRNEKGSYNTGKLWFCCFSIIALRNEKKEVITMQYKFII